MNYGKELSEDNNSYTSLNKTILKDRNDLLKLIEEGDIKKNPLEEEKLNELINSLNLLGKISLERGYISAGIDASKLAKLREEEIELASAKYETEQLLDKIKDATHAASLTRILASIESAKKIRYEKNLEYQKEKVKISLKELEYRRKIENEIRKRLYLEKELIYQFDNDIEELIKNKEKIELKIIEINKEIELKDGEKIDAKKIAELTLNKLKELERNLIYEDISRNEKRERQEILELLKLTIYTKEEIEKKIVDKYKKRKLEYEINAELKIIEKDKKRLENKIEKKIKEQENQIKYMILLKTDLDKTISKVLSVESLLEIENNKYERDKLSWEELINKTNNIIENILKEELEINIKIKKAEELIESTLSKKVIFKNEYEALLNNKNINNKEILSNKKLDLEKIELILINNKENLLKLENDSKKIINKKTNELNNKYNLLEKQKNNKYSFESNISKIKINYEKELLAESFKSRRTVSQSLKLTKIINNIYKLKNELLLMVRKIESINKKDYQNYEDMEKIVIKEFEDAKKHLINTKNIELEVKNKLNIAKDNLEQSKNEQEEKILELNKLLVKEKNDIEKNKIQNKLNIVSKNNNMQNIFSQKINSLSILYSEKLTKRALIQIAESKTYLDKVVISLIKIIKEIENINSNINIELKNNEVLAYSIKKEKIQIAVLKNELSRLHKMEKVGNIEIQRKKKLINNYNLILKENNDDKLINNLYNAEKNNIKLIEKDLVQLKERIKKINSYTSKSYNYIGNIEKKFLNLIEKSKFKIKIKEDTKIEKIKDVKKILNEYSIVSDIYLDLRNKIIKNKITNIPQYVLNPLPIPTDIKEFVISLLDNKDLEYKSYVNNDNFADNMDKLISNLINTIDIEKPIKKIPITNSSILSDKENTQPQVYDIIEMTEQELDEKLLEGISSMSIEKLQKIYHQLPLGGTAQKKVKNIKDFLKIMKNSFQKGGMSQEEAHIFIKKVIFDIINNTNNNIISLFTLFKEVDDFDIQNLPDIEIEHILSDNKKTQIIDKILKSDLPLSREEVEKELDIFIINISNILKRKYQEDPNNYEMNITPYYLLLDENADSMLKNFKEAIEASEALKENKLPQKIDKEIAENDSGIIRYENTLPVYNSKKTVEKFTNYNKDEYIGKKEIIKRKTSSMIYNNSSLFE